MKPNLSIRRYLRTRGLISDDIAVYHPRTRDRPDLNVNICRETEVIFLDSDPIASSSHYREKEIENDGITSLSIVDGVKITTATLADSERRIAMFRNIIANRCICDFGTGHGLFLRKANIVAARACGVEVNRQHVSALREEGFQIESDITDFPELAFDVVTLFHVLEHLAKPIETLQDIKSRMKADGRLIVEVPHACDFLHKTLGCEAFKNFTFWSEHLVLHTAQSLRRTLQMGGFSMVTVQGHQRYGLENHLHWLAKAKPGGHDVWAHLGNPHLNEAYCYMLQSIGQTDTLVATATA
jgi:2-polyprenyl-3-methyl-5-hydroxy-6-metoxy-1,4-benzoquinol methylase